MCLLQQTAEVVKALGMHAVRCNLIRDFTLLRNYIPHSVSVCAQGRILASHTEISLPHVNQRVFLAVGFAFPLNSRPVTYLTV